MVIEIAFVVPVRLKRASEQDKPTIRASKTECANAAYEDLALQCVVAMQENARQEKR